MWAIRGQTDPFPRISSSKARPQYETPSPRISNKQTQILYQYWTPSFGEPFWWKQLDEDFSPWGSWRYWAKSKNSGIWKEETLWWSTGHSRLKGTFQLLPLWETSYRTCVFFSWPGSFHFHAWSEHMHRACSTELLGLDIWTHSGWWFGTFFIFPYIGNNLPIE